MKCLLCLIEIKRVHIYTGNIRACIKAYQDDTKRQHMQTAVVTMNVAIRTILIPEWIFVVLIIITRIIFKLIINNINWQWAEPNNIN